MRTDSEIDRHLEIVEKHLPAGMLDAATFTADTMDIAWKIARSIFDERATPEIAIAVFDRLMTRRAAQVEALGMDPHGLRLRVTPDQQ